MCFYRFQRNGRRIGDFLVGTPAAIRCSTSMSRGLMLSGLITSVPGKKVQVPSGTRSLFFHYDLFFDHTGFVPGELSGQPDAQRAKMQDNAGNIDLRCMIPAALPTSIPTAKEWLPWQRHRSECFKVVSFTRIFKYSRHLLMSEAGIHGCRNAVFGAAV